VQFLIFSLSINAQFNKTIIDSVYGLNPLLYNGRIYSFSIARDTKGNPYFSGNEFEKGKVSIKGKVYEDLDLKYDIYNQQLLLKYANTGGATLIIELSKSWLDGFSISQANFEYKPGLEGQPCLFQVIKYDLVQVNYYWKKDLVLDNVFGTMTYTFTKAKRQQFVVCDGIIKNYRTNKEFINAFPAQVQKQISEHIKKNKIKVNKAANVSMHELVKYCNSLLTP